MSCSPEDNKPPQNDNPGILIIESISFQGKEVTIDWNDVEDADIIYYKLYVNSILIVETTESINTSTLEYNDEYEGRIIATDRNGGVSEIEFTFNSLKSKILFFSDSGGNFIAYDLITDEVLWQSNTSFIDVHTAYEDKIYSGFNGINALSILSGEIEWTSTPSINYNSEYRNIIVDETNVYAFDSDSNLHCVNRLSGEKLWERSFLNYYAPLTMDDSKVFVCSRNDNHLYAINKITGETDWGFRLNSSYKILTNPLIIDNNIYFGDYGGILYALNKNTGEKIWDVDADQYNSFAASPTIFENTIITGTFRTIYSYYKNDGSIKWTYNPSGTIETSPFVYNNNVYIGISKNGSGELVCLNATNGSIKWKYDLANNTTSSPIVFEDTVYIGDWGKNFYAINATTGILDWRFQTNEIITKSPTIVIGNSETIIYPSSHGLKN
jgi:outer membrane protein assembly factor BamB